MHQSTTAKENSPVQGRPNDASSVDSCNDLHGNHYVEVAATLEFVNILESNIAYFAKDEILCNDCFV